MIKLNIHEAKTHLSRHLKRLDDGERIVICRHNVPIAEIVPLPKPPTRAVGLSKGEFEIPANFFDPLPDDVLDAFEGTPD